MNFRMAFVVASLVVALGQSAEAQLYVNGYTFVAPSRQPILLAPVAAAPAYVPVTPVYAAPQYAVPLAVPVYRAPVVAAPVVAAPVVLAPVLAAPGGYYRERVVTRPHSADYSLRTYDAYGHPVSRVRVDLNPRTVVIRGRGF